ncbi:Uncharacterised protein [Candidatus Tiddalikarchaeum anstoanum]|nr:Uncharacterised protein [Candidatus Tiddalikarchaeum anstoanum]
MVTIPLLLENIIEKKPFLEEMLVRGLVNYAALAEMLKPELEKELKKEVKMPAVMMALRRLSEKMKLKLKPSPINFKESDVTVKSDIFEITVMKSQTIINNIKKIYDLVNFQRGDFLTMTHGIYEITILSNRQYREKIKKILEEEKIIKIIDKLAALTVKIPIRAVETIGIFYSLTKAMTWENINIIEIVSTLTELTLVLNEDDISKAFNTIKKLM